MNNKENNTNDKIFTIIGKIVVFLIGISLVIASTIGIKNAFKIKKNNKYFINKLEKVISDVTNKYEEDNDLFFSSKEDIIIYDLTSDLNYDVLGYTGYVIIDRTKESPYYIVFINDDNFYIYNWNITEKGLPTSNDIKEWKLDKTKNKRITPSDICRGYKYYNHCYTRLGYIIN